MDDEDQLNIPSDRIRESVPWKLRFAGQEDVLFDAALEAVTGDPEFTLEAIEALPGLVADRLSGLDLWEALSPDQVEEISMAFDFPASDVDALSHDLARALNTTLTPLHVPLPRGTAIERAQLAMQRTRGDLMAASERMVRGLERLEQLDTAQAADRDGAARFTALLKDYDRVLHEIEALHRKLGILATTPDVALDLRPADKRTVSDLRRRAVLTCLFSFWNRAGRSLTVTTDPIDSQRKGPLIAFVNAVVRCITDPSGALSGDIILDELTAFKRGRAGT